MRSSRWMLTALFLLGLVPPLSGDIGSNAKDTLPPLAISVDDQKVTVTGGQPGGKILIVGYERINGRFKVTFSRHRAYLPATDGGELVLSPRGGVPGDSLWIGVDVQSGRFGVVSPGPLPPRELPFADDALKNDNNGQLKKLVFGLPLSYLVVVRPGEGAWELTAGDGGRHDTDLSADGKTEMSIDDFRPLSDGLPALSQFRRNDLLLVFSPDQVAFSVVRVGAK